MTESKQAAGTQEEGGEPGEHRIDLEKLAERLYQLLKQEARVERERLGRFQER